MKCIKIVIRRDISILYTLYDILNIINEKQKYTYAIQPKYNISVEFMK